MSTPASTDCVSAEPVKNHRCVQNAIVIQPLPSDIDACVSFSLIRCVISIFTIGLVLTDIPRTGLFLDLTAYFPKVGPDTVFGYGPYAYPVAHLSRSNRSDSSSSIAGYSGDSRIQALDVWSYKFDTLSIPTRALAEHLNVPSYPPCLLYREPCASLTLDLETSLAMLDDLITAIDNQYFAQDRLRHLPVVFYTKSNWADRLHHVIVGKFGYRIDTRVHAVYRFAVKKDAAFHLCNPRSAAESHHPLVCKPPVKWLCPHPFRKAQAQVSLVESTNLRVAALQQQYPDSELDVTLITTRNELQSLGNTWLPGVFYHTANAEITSLVRGRDCQSGSPCKTIFLDDYRYERATLETSSDRFRIFPMVLRAVSQAYVWLRIFLLIFICWRVRLSEPKYRDSSLVVKLGAVLFTIAKIPSHLIVYSSWFPIIGYSVAHFADCALTHIIEDNFWASSNGFFSFDFIRYIEVASIQMRNIWLIALAWKCGIAIFNRIIVPRARRWQPQQGVIAFRGHTIGAASFLTIFTFLRALRFRDTRVLNFLEVHRNRGAANEFLKHPLHKSSTDFGNQLDIQAAIVASVIVVGLVHLARFGFHMSWKSTTRSFFCHSLYVPLSAGVLFPASALHPFWYIRLSRVQSTSPEAEGGSIAAHHRQPSSRVLVAVLPVGLKTRRLKCETCDFASTAMHWRAVQGCRKHETLFDVGRRSVETQSVVRLTHIGVFSDPIVFFQLRVLGKQLYVYRVRDQTVSVNSTGEKCLPATMGMSDRKSTAFLSPARLVPDGAEWPFSISDDRADCELVAHVNSAMVPWALLADCG